MPGSIFNIIKYSFSGEKRYNFDYSNFVATIAIVKCIREFIRKNGNVTIDLKYIFSYRTASKIKTGIIPISNADSNKDVYA